MATPCSNPSPAKTPTMFLQQILCAIQGISSFLSGTSPDNRVSRLRNASVTTAWLPLPAVAGSYVSILNSTGANLQTRRADEVGAGNIVTIADGGTVGYYISANSSEIQITAAGAAAGVQIVVD